MNSFHITLRTPPEILGIISSYLAEEDLFSASQVCKYWRSVLISISSLWTRIHCDNSPRTIANLERSKSLPIQLRLEPLSPSAALENVLFYRNKVASLTLNREPDTIPQLQQLFVISSPSLERLHIYADDISTWGNHQRTLHTVWQDFPSLRELFASQFSVPINQLAAPNLVHLALEPTGYTQNVTVQTILNMLRGCPLLETLLLHHPDAISPGSTRGHTPVRLPHLRSIELGQFEIHSKMLTFLDFPRKFAVGFRATDLSSVCGNIPLTVLASIQHVLRRIDTRCITLATPPGYHHPLLLVRFEGPYGSLEITVWTEYDHNKLQDIFFGPEGALFSHLPCIENVTELHVVGCYFDSSQGFRHVSEAMPNLISISFFDCDHTSLLLVPQNCSSPPFPRLERVMVLGEEPMLEEMVRARRDLGMPLKTLLVGRGPLGSGYDSLVQDYSDLAEFVEDLQIGYPTKILEWGTGNEIRNIWSTVKESGPVSPTDNANLVVVLITFCRSFSKTFPRLSFFQLHDAWEYDQIMGHDSKPTQ